MKHILNTLAFYVKYNGWQSFDRTCRPTVKAIQSLEKRGYLEVSYTTCQARFTGKTFN